MTETPPPIAMLTDDALQSLFKRAIRNTLILGLLAAVALLMASGWRNAGMLATGALISAASILEWKRLVGVVNRRMRQEKAPHGNIGAILVVGFFLVRLMIFAAVIYGSLKWFKGSGIALVCGLSLAVVTLTWEALRLLKE